MTLAWFHSLSPFLVRFTDSFGIRWYGLAYLCGFACAYLALRAMSKRGLIALPYDRIGDAMLWLIGGVLIGGRVGYALVYDLPTALQRGEPPLIFSFSGGFPFWGLLAINQGGMSSHGGIAGVILAAWRVSRGWRADGGSGASPGFKIIGRTSLLHTLDALALVTPAGLFFGRIANFINGELLGKIVAAPGTRGPWWAVQYPQELEQWKLDKVSKLPVPGSGLQQTPEQWNQILDLARSVAPNGDPGAGLRRLAHEGYLYADTLKPLISARHPSQLYQAAAEGLILAAVLWAIWAKPRKPGIIGCWFMITYGVLRIITEIYRLPDAHLLIPRPLGLSYGQWLSAAMVLIGAAFLATILKRPTPKLGGWRTVAPPG